MTELVRFRSDDGPELVVEVSETGGTQRVSRGADGVANAARNLEDAIAVTMPAVEKIVAAVSRLTPDKHDVEFGLKLTAEAGAVIARTKLEGHFIVKLTWDGSRDTGPGPEGT